MLSAKVSTKHQIAIPSEARKRLGIEPGDRLTVDIVDDTLVLRVRPARPSDRLRGLGSEIWKGKDPVKHVRSLRETSDAGRAGRRVK